MSKKKKTNPNKQLVTRAELNKAVKEERNKVFLYWMALSLFSLHNKKGFGAKRLNDFWTDVNELSEMVSEGYLTLDDILDTIYKESKIQIINSEE